MRNSTGRIDIVIYSIADSTAHAAELSFDLCVAAPESHYEYRGLADRARTAVLHVQNEERSPK